METNDTKYLLPSQIFVSKTEYFVTTVLGSCVAVCLWDSVNNIGGINHFMLPYWNGKGLETPKYGNIANDKLLKTMLSKGSSIQNIKAKVFGGGDVIGNESPIFNIGKRNIEVALLMLEEYGIKIIAQSIGGDKGRKIIFNTYTGQVQMKYINRQNHKE